VASEAFFVWPAVAHRLHAMTNRRVLVSRLISSIRTRLDVRCAYYGSSHLSP
jgi:hypothetical protein